jgi:hypothetical protein
MFRPLFALSLLVTLSAAARVSSRAPSCGSNFIADFTLKAVSKSNSTNSTPLFVILSESGHSQMVSQLTIFVAFFSSHGDANELPCVQGSGDIDGQVARSFSMANGVITATGNLEMSSFSEPLVADDTAVLFTPLSQPVKPSTGPFCEAVSSDCSTSLE